MMYVIITSLTLFFLAALLEISGGYLVWLWVREHSGWLMGLVGAIILFIYGIIPTLQPTHFGRVYAVYGGIFIVSSLLWGLIVEKKKPDRYEVIGAIIVLIGAAVMMYWPR